MCNKEQKVIRFYSDFSCLGAECPENCCRFWDVPVDEDTLRTCADKKDAEAILMRVLVHKNVDQVSVLPSLGERCFYLKRNKLCKLQCKGREDLMPLVCRMYPRSVTDYGTYVEGTLDLSCIEAARLFLKNRGAWETISVEDETLPIYDAPEGVDTDFLPKIRKVRQQVTDWLFEEGNLWEKQRLLAEYALSMHELLCRDRVEEALALSPEEAHPATERAGDFPSKEAKPGNAKPLYPLELVNEIFLGSLTDRYLQAYHPTIYRLRRRYLQVIKGMSAERGQVALENLWDDLLEKYPRMEDVLRDYLIYLLGQGLLMVSIDYYVVEPIFMSMLEMQIFQLILILAEADGMNLGDDMVLAELLSKTERALRHNEEFRRDAMNMIRSFLAKETG